MENLIVEDNKLTEKSGLIVIENIEKDEFSFLMSIYKSGLDSITEKFLNLKQILNEYYGYEMITNVTSRIKTPESIINKMKKKKYKLTCENLIEKINDIAGVRIVCNFTDDIYKIKNMISLLNNVQIVKEKDYIKNSKKSGYSAYHMIVKVPVELEEQTAYVKVEIQIRTVLMDYWATTEHKVKYKSNKKLSSLDSKKLSIYARVIRWIGDSISKIYKKQNKTEKLCLKD